MAPGRFLLLAAGVALLVSVYRGGARAAGGDVTYQIQPIVRHGDQVGAVSVKSDAAFFVGGLNDKGQIALVTDNAAGGQALVQSTDGRLTPIVAAGGDAPGGKWSPKVGIRSPVSMNQLGSIVFAADVVSGGQSDVGTFRWDYAARRVTPVLLKGMPGAGNLALEQGGGQRPAINDRNEMALVAPVKNAAGKPQEGVFFMGQDDRLQPVAIPDQPLPGLKPLFHAGMPSVNDTGVVAFLAWPRDDYLDRPCLWEHGTLTPLLELTQKAFATHLAAFTGIWVNNKNRSVLLAALLHGLSGASISLFSWSDGKLTPVVVPGQSLPGGGRFQTVQPQNPNSIEVSLATGVSAPNQEGEFVFLATQENGATGAYRVDAEGNLSLVLKGGGTTSLGKIANVGQGNGRSQGVGFNNRGQVALTVKITGGAEMVALLTPAP